jgi:large subunit ribosomal protein L29
MSKIKDLRAKTEDQLEGMIVDSKKELMNLRFQLKNGALTNTSRVKKVRKTVAKIKTLLNNKQPKNKKKAGVKSNA